MQIIVVTAEYIDAATTSPLQLVKTRSPNGSSRKISYFYRGKGILIMTRKYIEAAKALFFVDDVSYVSPATPVYGENYKSYRVCFKSGLKVELYEGRDDSTSLDRKDFVNLLKSAIDND